jgi:outer membrane receptor protein involved in Fe transport
VSQSVLGGVGTAFINDQYRPLPWLTLDGGLRFTHFSGATDENAVNPRVGASITLPRLKWVLHGFYGTYYQEPPLYTVSGALFNFSGLTGAIGFLPLKGERDIQREIGLAIPLRGWTLDLAHFATSARNFLDHDMLGNSNITLPLTIANARIIGSEATLRSPQMWHRRLMVHGVFSNMTAQGLGAVTGGMLEWTPPSGYYFLDHDQRNTVAGGVALNLPGAAWVSGNVVYGSGYLMMNGPEHLPQHITGDISFGKPWGHHWTTGITVLNLANTRYLLGLESAFAGTHYSPPREIIGQLNYRFNYRRNQ